MGTLLFVTNNKSKAKEVEEALKENNFPIHVIASQNLIDLPHVLEAGTTFLANAKLKAHQIAESSNLPTLADDPRLSVDKLNGASGVCSTQYGGEAHNNVLDNVKLLAELGGVPKEARKVTFHTTMVVSWPGKFKDDLVTEGEIRGKILTYPQSEGNFGYDPLFFVSDKGKTFAEMTMNGKGAISRRGQALRKLLAKLPAWWKRMESK